MPERVTVASLLLFLSHSTAAGRRTKKLSPHEGQDARCLWMAVAFIGFGSLYWAYSPFRLRWGIRLSCVLVHGRRFRVGQRRSKWTLIPKDYITRADNLDLFPASVVYYWFISYILLFFLPLLVSFCSLSWCVSLYSSICVLVLNLRLLPHSSIRLSLCVLLYLWFFSPCASRRYVLCLLHLQFASLLNVCAGVRGPR